MRFLLVALMITVMPAVKPAGAVSKKVIAPVNTTFALFWPKFREAVAKDDREAVASMTKLPFLLEGRELNRDGFIKRYQQLFDRKVKRCFAKGQTVRDGDSYSLFCGETIFLFGKDKREYKFLEIGVND